MLRVATCRDTTLEWALGALSGIEILPLSSTGSADVLWMSKSTRARTTGEVVREIKAARPGLKVVMWDGDVRTEVAEHVRAHGDRIDLLLVGHEDVDQGTMLRNSGVQSIDTFYHGVRPQEFCVLGWPKGRPSLFFGGTNYLGRDDEYPLSGVRLELVDALQRHLGLVGIAGEFWPERFDSVLPTLSIPVYCSLMRSHAITIGCNHFDLPRYYTKRLFDSLAAGRLHLTRYIPEMEADFDNHGNIVWFHSIEEAVDLARWYLDHAEDRVRIATAGYQLVIAKHTEELRAVQLAKILHKVCGREFKHE